MSDKQARGKGDKYGNNDDDDDALLACNPRVNHGFGVRASPLRRSTHAGGLGGIGLGLVRAVDLEEAQ